MVNQLVQIRFSYNPHYKILIPACDRDNLSDLMSKGPHSMRINDLSGLISEGLHNKNRLAQIKVS